MTIEEIESELATKCHWCGGSKVTRGMPQYWCLFCGGSGLSRTDRIRGYPRMALTTEQPQYLEARSEHTRKD